MLEFFRVLLADILCHRRNDPLARSNRRKNQNVNLSQCQIKEKVKEEVANDQEVYRIRNILENNRIEANQFSSKQQVDEVRRTASQQSPEQKLSVPDKSTTYFVQVASFGTQTTEEWKFKRVTTIVSKATQTPLFTADNEETNGENEFEERLKRQAWKDAKFFVTHQLLAQCLHTTNCTKVWRSAGNYSSTKS